MIKICDKDYNITDYIDTLSYKNPFGCRIKALYNTYDYSLAFVDYWVQIVDDTIAALIARMESSFILRLTDNSDLEEVSAFLRVSGADNIICDGRYELDVPMKRISGPVFVSESVMENEKDFKVFNPHIKDVYNLINKCRSESFSVPSYESFALDVAHKLSKKTLRIYGIGDTKLISCIMTLAETDTDAVLGALATDPDFRRLGHGAFLIRYINNVLVKEEKRVYLHRAPNENVEFYNKLGFKEYGKWSEYR
ncbi:MAG: GNAT family N-acetyltransferase [Ruminococcus sp.]|nr:GNAT family N-acetyltransferase [Ruminococcus sp.]